MIKLALELENAPATSRTETRTIGRYSVTVRMMFANKENTQVADSVGDFLKNGYRRRIIA